MKILACSSVLPFGREVAGKLGVELSPRVVKNFPDREVFVKIGEVLAGEKVFVIQSTSSPVNDNLMELLVLLDAVSRLAAKEVNIVIPYFGYARQDKEVVPGVSVSARLVAKLIENVGANRVILLDVHSSNIQDFFGIELECLSATPLFAEDIKNKFDCRNIVVISPDVGGVERAKSVAQNLNSPMVILEKRRNRSGKIVELSISGDVDGKDCIIIDDIVDSAQTICKAAEVLIRKGQANSASAYVTHPVFMGESVKRVEQSPLKRLVVTDSICLKSEAKKCKKIEILSIATLVSEAIKRISCRELVK